MNVPFLELLPTYKELQPEMDEAYHRVMESGRYLLGKELEAFEADFAQYCDAKHCVGCGNGLDALHLILRAYDIGPGDEVIVPAHTFIATWLAVSYTGAKPVPVDIEPIFYNLDPAQIEAAITSRTKAIMPVHLYGHPADMAPINRIAAKNGLRVIEDSAQAHGAGYQGRRCGTLGHAAAFSFYPGKNLGAFTDAGAVVTNDSDLAAKVKKMRNYGSAVKYSHELLGINSRIDELTAAFLRIKLAKLDEWNVRRQKVASQYLSLLAGATDLGLPEVLAGCTHSWHLFVVRHPRRDEIQLRLAEQEIGALIHYPVPPSLSEAYAKLKYRSGDFPVAECAARQVLSLPVGPHLREEQVAFVAGVLRRCC